VVARCVILRPLSAREKLAMRDAVSRLVRLGAKVVDSVDFDCQHQIGREYKKLKVRFEPGSRWFCLSRTLNRTCGPVRHSHRTSDRTSVRFGKVQVRTLVLNRTAATLCETPHNRSHVWKPQSIHCGQALYLYKTRKVRISTENGQIFDQGKCESLGRMVMRKECPWFSTLRYSLVLGWTIS